MASDLTFLDTTQRNKLLAALAQLGDIGGTEADLLGEYNRIQGIGRTGLQDYYNTAGLAIGQQYEPTFDNARDFLGGSPLLADSGYSNRLNRQILTELGGRMVTDYGRAAADQSNHNLDFLRSGYGARRQNRYQLAQGAAPLFMGLGPKKKKFGQQILEGGLQLAGAGTGAYLSRPSKPKLPGSAYEDAGVYYG